MFAPIGVDFPNLIVIVGYLAVPYVRISGGMFTPFLSNLNKIWIQYLNYCKKPKIGFWPT